MESCKKKQYKQVKFEIWLGDVDKVDVLLLSLDGFQTTDDVTDADDKWL